MGKKKNMLPPLSPTLPFGFVNHARTLTLRLRLGLVRLADLIAAWRAVLAPA